MSPVRRGRYRNCSEMESNIVGVVFPLPPTGLKPLGRPLLEKSNTLRPVRCGAQRTLAARRQQQYSRGVATFLSPKPGPPSPGPLFFVFVFPLPPAGFRPLGRPLSERSKTYRPGGFGVAAAGDRSVSGRHFRAGGLGGLRPEDPTGAGDRQLGDRHLLGRRGQAFLSRG